MSVDLRNYVQVNIDYKQVKPLNRTRDTVILFTINETASAPQGRLNTHIPEGASESVDYYTSLADYEYAISQYNDNLPAGETAIADNSTSPVLYNYVKCYFNNGGVKLKIIGGFTHTGDSPSESELKSQQKTWILNECVKLKAEEIVVASDCDEDVLEEVARSSVSIPVLSNGINSSKTVSALTGYKEKIYISSTTSSALVINNPEKIPNFVIKFGGKGIEMAAAAYLSQVNISDARTIQDYCYTIEDVSMFSGSVIDDNASLVALAEKHFNVDTTLVNNIRNVMGDTVAPYDLMNYYVRIILTQTLTDRILNTLVTKIKFDRTGINKVINAITQELNLYKSNGYLNTEFIWTEENLYYNFNGVDYLICERNTPFKMGYKFTILPIGSLTQEQRDAHVFPPVYVLIADSMSIRQIVINGEAY